MAGPIFVREWLVAPRKLRFYLQRVVFVLALFSLVCTAWALLAGVQQVRNIGDLAKFGLLVFRIVVPVELVITMFLSAVACASSVAQEKDKRTLVLLLLTRLTSTDIVVGKLAANLVAICLMILTAAPLLLLISLMGGVTLTQVAMATVVILVTSVWVGALATVIGFWREKTFQALAVTVLVIVGWLVLCESIAAGAIGIDPRWADCLSPFRAVWLICQPIPNIDFLPQLGGAASAYCLLGAVAATLITCVGIVRLRVWNPSRQVRAQAAEPDEDYAIQAGHTDTVQKTWKVRTARPMWNNPVLWREVRTWAYGRKLLFIRLAYVGLFAAAVIALMWSIQSGAALQRSRLAEELIPVSAQILAPFFVVSLVLINALAVNSITNERDAQALDLLLTTQITPTQFLLGKIVGVLYVTKEMVLLPIALVAYFWWSGGLGLENMLLTIGCLLVLDLFAAVLGIHCGMGYGQSRTAIGTSLGTIFFLCLGIVTCMMIMLSFRGSFARQLPPFLAVILGGGTGLFVALGSRNPSPAIALASFALPFLTFFAITSFILRNQELTIFSVVTAAYGFATLAMLVPALSELDFAMGKTRTIDEEG